MKAIWRWLNGNKTIITGALLGMLQLEFVKRNIPPQTLEMLNWGIGTLTLLSGGHHLAKGYFSTKVGNPGQTPKNINVQK